jgi:voltage-gated sodium channel
MEESAVHHAHAVHPGGKKFELLVNFAIIASCGVTVLSFCIDEEYDKILEPIHVSFLVFFAIEMGVRLADVNWNPNRFLRASRWNGFDATVIALSLLPALGMDIGLLRVARAARLIHSLRHLSHLRLLVRLDSFIRHAAKMLHR